MSVIQRCNKCILPASLPSVKLDGEGMCNHCRSHEQFMQEWNSSKEARFEKWKSLVASAKKQGRRYDCVVPLSGGKDSTYVLYACSKLYGMKCLCVTFDNGFLTSQARTNIQSALDACEADHMMVRISRSTLLKLYGAYVARCGSFCAVCMRGIDESIQMAKRSHGIPLVVTGGGRRVTYLSMLPELLQNGEVRFFSKVAHGTAIESEAAMLGAKKRLAVMPRLFFRIERKLRGMLSPRNSFDIYDYLDVDRSEVQKVISSEMGWRKSGEHFEHTDCGLHPVVGYVHAHRFTDVTAETAHLSGRIRMGEITRDEALRIEHELLANPEHPEILASFLEEIEMPRADFDRYASDWRAAQRFRI